MLPPLCVFQAVAMHYLSTIGSVRLDHGPGLRRGDD
jgi:hypothetical protein